MYICILLIFVFFVGFRGEYVDNDRSTYELYMNNMPYGMERSFVLISYLCYDLLHSSLLVFVVYAFLALFLKFYSIKIFSDFFFLSLLIYYSNVMFLDEMNAIRAGVASGFFLLSVSYWKDDKIVGTVFFLFLACFFHYSYLVFLPLIFMIDNTSKYLFYYILLVPFSYLICKFVPFGNFLYEISRLDYYIDDGQNMNVYSLIYLMKIPVLFFLYFKRKCIICRNSQFYIFMKLYSVGICISVLLSRILPVVGWRIFTMFFVLDVFIFPMLLYCFRQKWIAILFILIYSYRMLLVNTVINDYVRPYKMIFDV